MDEYNQGEQQRIGCQLGKPWRALDLLDQVFCASSHPLFDRRCVMLLPASGFRKSDGIISLLDQGTYLSTFERLDSTYLEVVPIKLSFITDNASRYQDPIAWMIVASQKISDTTSHFSTSLSTS